MAVALLRGLLLIPLFIEFIGDRVYGLWLASGGILVWLSMFDLGIGRGLLQRIAHFYGQKDYKKTGEYFLNGLIIYFAISLLIMLSGLILSVPLPSLIKSNPNEISLIRKAFQIAVFSNALYVINNVLRGFATALQRPLLPMVGMVFFSLLGLFVTITLLINQVGLLSIPIGHLVNQLGLFFIKGSYSIILLKSLGKKFKIKRDIIYDLKSITPSLFGAKIGESVVKNIEPTLIAIFLKPELATFFTVTKRTGDMVSQSLHIIMGSIFPSLSHLYGEGDRKKAKIIVEKIMNIAILGGIVGFGTYFISNGHFIKIWIGEEYFLGNILTLLIALGLFFNLLFSFMSDILVSYGDIRFASYSVLAESIFRLLLLFVFISTLGIYGLTLSLLFSCALFSYLLFKRYELMVVKNFFDQNLKHILKSLITTLPILLIFLYLELILNSWTHLIVYTIIVCVSILFGNMMLRKNRLLVSDIILKK